MKIAINTIVTVAGATAYSGVSCIFKKTAMESLQPINAKLKQRKGMVKVINGKRLPHLLR